MVDAVVDTVLEAPAPAPAVNLLSTTDVIEPNNPCEAVPVLISPEIVVAAPVEADVSAVLVDRVVLSELDEDCVKIEVFAVPFIPIQPGKVSSISSPRTP